MKWLVIVVVVYGLINLAGGIAGFVAAQSVVSLVAGGLAGLLLILSAALTGSRPALAWRSAGVVTFLLLVFWAYQWYAGQFAMGRAFGNLVLAALVLACLAYGHFSKTRRSALSG